MELQLVIHVCRGSVFIQQDPDDIIFMLHDRDIAIGLIGSMLVFFSGIDDAGYEYNGQEKKGKNINEFICLMDEQDFFIPYEKEEKNTCNHCCKKKIINVEKYFKSIYDKLDNVCSKENSHPTDQ